MGVVVAWGVGVVFVVGVGMGVAFVTGVGDGVVVVIGGVGIGVRMRVVVAGIAAGVGVRVRIVVAGVAAGVVGVALGGVGIVGVVFIVPVLVVLVVVLVGAVLVIGAVLVVGAVVIVGAVVVVPAVVLVSPVVVPAVIVVPAVVVPAVIVIPAVLLVHAVVVFLAVVGALAVVAIVVVAAVVLVPVVVLVVVVLAVVVLALRGGGAGAVVLVGSGGVVVTDVGCVVLVAHAFVVSLGGGIVVGTTLRELTKAGGARIRDALASRIRSGGATVMPLSTSFRLALDMSIESKKREGRGGAYGVSLVGEAWLASSAAFWALVFLLSMVIDGGESTSTRCVPWLLPPLRLRLLPPFSFLPHLHSFHLLVRQFGLCRLLWVFLVLLLALARLVTSVGQPLLMNGCVGMYVAAT